MNKGGYRKLQICTDNRIKIIDEFCNLTSRLPLKIMNIVVNKSELRNNSDVLDTALDWSINRIERDMDYNHPGCKYLIITDEGRLSKMRYTARRLHKFNMIKLCNSGITENKVIKKNVEDILAKDSEQSYFIQIADMISYIVYMYSLNKFNLDMSKQLPRTIDFNKTQEWLTTLQPVLNLEANKQRNNDKYGIVFAR